MARLLAPDRDDLRHDAREIGVHDTGVDGGGRRTSNKIENTDAERTHGCLAISELTPARTRELNSRARDWVTTLKKTGSRCVRIVVLRDGSRTEW